ATYSPAALAAVPWALGALTAEFGMGSGGIPPLGPPGRQRTFQRDQYDTLLADEENNAWTFFQTWNGAGNQANRAIRTSKLNALLRLHTWPIDVVVFHGSQAK